MVEACFGVVSLWAAGPQPDLPPPRSPAFTWFPPGDAARLALEALLFGYSTALAAPSGVALLLPVDVHARCLLFCLGVLWLPGLP